ncbi:hypothetical protein J4227_07090 [Candidatus Woesearchaeota archaeon]|nr:hypothetical protein [Candidatus Woesearchaeota archaeon]
MENSKAKPYITGAMLGAAGYFILSNFPVNSQQFVATQNNPANLSASLESFRHETLQAVEQRLEQERIREYISSLEQRIAEQNTPVIPPYQNSGYGYSTPLNAAQIESPPQAAESYAPSLENGQSSYPTHDIYFSWQRADNGVARTRSSYQISLNTGKITENIRNFGTWFKGLFER